jgi:hypothetical protein
MTIDHYHPTTFEINYHIWGDWDPTVADHLRECSACKAEYDRLKEQEQQVDRFSRDTPQSSES